MLARVAVAQFLGMTLWFSATAAGPAIAAEFLLTRSATAWLTMAVQAGFVAGTLISSVLNLADVLNARRLFALGCIAGAAANASIPSARRPRRSSSLRGFDRCRARLRLPAGNEDRRRMVQRSSRHGTRDRGRRADDWIRLSTIPSTTASPSRPATTSTLGAGAASAPPSARSVGISIQAVSPTSHLWIVGKYSVCPTALSGTSMLSSNVSRYPSSNGVIAVYTTSRTRSFAARREIRRSGRRAVR